MANYAMTNGSTDINGTYTSSAAYAGAILTAGAPTASMRRGKIYDVLVGTVSTPADAYMEFAIDRVTTVSTAAATGTLVAASKLDAADAAAISVTTVNSTAFGTISSAAQQWYIGMNQRASYRWVCAPGSELVWPATASNGMTLRSRGAQGINASGNWFFQEQ